MKIKKFMAMLLATMVLFGCTSGCGAAVYQQQRYVADTHHVDHLMNSVVALVEVNEEGRARTFCSGFFVRRDIIATAAHCVAVHEETEIMPGVVLETVLPPVVGARFRYETYSQFLYSQRNVDPVPYTATVAAFDTDTDVALLRVGPLDVSRNVLAMNEANPTPGEAVYALGHPVGLSWILTEGMVSQLMRKPNGEVEWINSSAQVFFGNSGGPLVNDHGQVIGVASAIVARQSHLAIYSPIHNIATLLNALPVQTVN